MKRYIIMSYDIHPLGGCQNYIWGKAAYLEERGWDVFVLFAGSDKLPFTFPFLAKFADGNIPALDWVPAQLPSCLQKHVLKDMVSVVSSKHGKQYEQTIIESHHDKTHLWGEILAKELHAKHICFNCNELFRGPDKYFEPYLAFFEFKYRRKELYGITEISVSRLFDGYNGLHDLKEKNFKAKTPDSVQDVSSAAVDELPSADWSICYIGRILKSYVDNILRDVALFAQRHTDKKINFITVGDASAKKEKIDTIFASLKNVTVVYLGNQVPIPRSLFSKTDVILAGSGCAYAARNEGVPIILPDPENCSSNGLYRYENMDSIKLDEGRSRESFFDSLERVLVQKVHENMTFVPVEDNRTAADFYDEHMQMIADSSTKKEFYSTEVLTKNDLTFRQKIGMIYQYYFRKLI